MTNHYGSIEAARLSYRSERAALGFGEVLWVAGSGRIVRVGVGDVQYRGSADACNVLPS